ncbi:MAG: ATP-dependent nuclease [Methanobacterium sp.]
MIFKSIKIQNYRGLMDVNIPLSDFVCITGKNNSGKSSTLLALSLFISGSSIPINEYYDSSKPIEIEVELSDIKDEDFERIEDSPREKIRELIINDELTLMRRFEDGSNKFFYKCLVPKDRRFDESTIDEVLKGKRGNGIKIAMQGHLPEYSDYFDEVTSQSGAKEIVGSIITNMNGDELEEGYLSIPLGIKDLLPLLPEPIFIPAVKDVNDDVKTKESATFGKIISLFIDIIEEANIFQDITDIFDDFKNLMNKEQLADGSIVDNRINELIQIERQINSYIQENFPGTEITLKFPQPALKKFISESTITVNDGVDGDIDSKGDGLKRAVVFSLLRTYIDLKKQKSNGENQFDLDDSHYLFLFEEPELYLHPNAQKILFEALSGLSTSHQVIVTTHSPLFFSPFSTGTFVKMKKLYEEGVVPYSKSIDINLHNDVNKKDLFQLICFENNSAAFFADKAVLVEGDSDLYFFRHVSKILNSDWDFDSNNIPIIKIEGKGNVRRYNEFFNHFEVELHIILDLDVIIDGFKLLGLPDDIIKLREKLIKELDKIVEDEKIELTFTGKKIKSNTIRNRTWMEKYMRLREIIVKISEGENLTNEEIEEFQTLFLDEEEASRRYVLESGNYDSKLEYKEKLLNCLRSKGIYVLSKGAVEEYYPDGFEGEDKPSKAISACKLLSDRTEIINCCPMMNSDGEEKPELELIFENIFNDLQT